jgi:multidrug efflux pump
VYAPIGIQGGLTGALFREFAFTLGRRRDRVRNRGPDAVAHDGLEAPAHGRRREGLRRLDQPALREGQSTYARLLAGSLNYRPVVYAIWVIVVLL